MPIRQAQRTRQCENWNESGVLLPSRCRFPKRRGWAGPFPKTALRSATRERNPRAGIAPISTCLKRAAQLSRRARGRRQARPKLSGSGPGHSRLIPLKLWAPVGPATPGLQHGSVLLKQTAHPSRHVLQKKSFLKKGQYLEKCCKTHIYTPPLGGQKTQAYCLAPQKNLLTGCVSKPFSKHMWRPEMR